MQNWSTQSTVGREYTFFILIQFSALAKGSINTQSFINMGQFKVRYMMQQRMFRKNDDVHNAYINKYLCSVAVIYCFMYAPMTNTKLDKNWIFSFGST